MTESSQATQKKGCGPIMVAMIAFFALIVGFLSGAGALFGFLYASEEGVYQMNLAERYTPPVASTPEREATQAPPQERTLSADEIYALAYPIQETLHIQGALDEQAVRNRLSRDRFALQECYQEELSRNSSTRGEMSLQFTVSGSNGRVVAAVSRGNYTGSEPLSRCVLDKIRQWSFPSPDSSQVSVVRFDMLFLPFRADQ